MASFDLAFPVVMKHEDDPVIKGKITRNSDGRWADKLSEVPEQYRSTAVQVKGRWYYAFTRTRYGVDERAHPELRNGGFYSTMPTEKAEVIAKGVFHTYWKFDQINDQVVATKILDACINMGPGNALKVVQRALSQQGHGLPSWQWGPLMLEAINGCDIQTLVNSLTQCALDYYTATAAKQELKEVPGGWINRAKWDGPVPTSV